MNIESPNITQTNSTRNNKTQNVKNSSVKFSDELSELQKTSNEISEKKNVEEVSKNEEIEENSVTEEDENLDKAVDGLNSVVEELNKKSDQTEDESADELKNDKFQTDNNYKGNNALINNDFNIQDNKDLLSQMNPNMNFSGNGQPFSSSSPAGCCGPRMGQCEEEKGCMEAFQEALPLLWPCKRYGRFPFAASAVFFRMSPSVPRIISSVNKHQKQASPLFRTSSIPFSLSSAVSRPASVTTNP